MAEQSQNHRVNVMTHDANFKDQPSIPNSFNTNFDMTNKIQTELNGSKHESMQRRGFGLMKMEMGQDLQSPQQHAEAPVDLMGKIGGSRQGNVTQSIGESAFNFQAGSNGNMQ